MALGQIRRERMRGRVTVRAEGLDEALKHFNQFDNWMLARLGRKITTASVIMQQQAILSVLRHFNQRTGKFRKSLHLRVVSRTAGGSKGAPIVGTVWGEVFSDHPGAAIQDVGGIIRAKGKAMTIPMTEEARKNRPKDFGDRLKLTRSGYLVESVGFGGKIAGEGVGRRHFGGTVFQYALRKMVRLPATHYMLDAVNRADPLILAEINEAVGLTVTRSGPA